LYPVTVAPKALRGAFWGTLIGAARSAASKPARGRPGSRAGRWCWRRADPASCGHRDVEEDEERGGERPSRPGPDVGFLAHRVDRASIRPCGRQDRYFYREPFILLARMIKMREKSAELTPEQRSRFRWDDAFSDLSPPE